MKVTIPELSFKTHLQKIIAMLSIQSTSYAKDPAYFKTHMFFPKELLKLVANAEGLI
jgi:hypothetical protein